MMCMYVFACHNQTHNGVYEVFKYNVDFPWQKSSLKQERKIHFLKNKAVKLLLAKPRFNYLPVTVTFLQLLIFFRSKQDISASSCFICFGRLCPPSSSEGFPSILVCDRPDTINFVCSFMYRPVSRFGPRMWKSNVWLSVYTTVVKNKLEFNRLDLSLKSSTHPGQKFSSQLTSLQPSFTCFTEATTIQESTNKSREEILLFLIKYLSAGWC